MGYLTLYALAIASAVAATGRQSPPMTGLILWLDASDRTTLRLAGERVEAWGNKVPGIKHGFVAEDTARPRYVARRVSGVRAAIRFDGIDDVLRCRRFGIKAPRWTLMVVAAPFSSGRDGALCSACPTGGNDFDPGFTVDLYRSGAKFDQVSVEGAGRIGGQKDQMRSRLPYGTPHVIVVERADRTIRLFIDGTLEGTRPVQPATTIMEELRVGARFYGGSERCYFDGEISEVLLYDRPLTPSERTAIETSRRVTEKEHRILEKAFMKAQEERERNRMIAPRLVRAWPSIEIYEQQTGKQVLQLPMRTDIRKAIQLCVHHLNSLYDADRNDEPYFYANMRPDGTGVLLHSLEIGVPHVVGRCLLGCMMAEREAGVAFPPDGAAILERYCRSSFDTPYRLNAYVDPSRGGKRFVELHNVREGLYGLWALIVGRNSQWARDTARKMVRTLDAMTDERGRWSEDLAAKAGLAGVCSGMSVPNAARAVEPLVAYYSATGDPVALKLAGLYAHAALEEMFDADGHFTSWEKSSGHVHSITSALSGITAYAMLAEKKAMLLRCKQIMDVGVPEYFSSWGWGDEVFPEHPANEPSRGEINQTGDVIRTALLVGDAGYTGYYELAERFVRSMLLPTQHRAEEMRTYLHENKNPKNDSERNIIERCIGGTPCNSRTTA